VDVIFFAGEGGGQGWVEDGGNFFCEKFRENLAKNFGGKFWKNPEKNLKISSKKILEKSEEKILKKSEKNFPKKNPRKI
jgi:hypothetical protein